MTVARVLIAFLIVAGLVASSLYAIHSHPAKLYRALLKHTGLSGADGDLSFSKAVTLLVLAIQPPAVLGIACIAAAFGARVFGRFLEHSAFIAQATDIRQKIDHEIHVRRDPDMGIESTP